MSRMLTVRIPEGLRESLHAEAEANREPLSRLIRRLLERGEGWSQRPDGTWDKLPTLTALSHYDEVTT